MADVHKLSISHCILLAVHYASDSNVTSLRNLTQSRPDAFEPDLILRIILTCLPESTEPNSYATYLHEIVTRSPLDDAQPTSPLDTSPVHDLSDSKARKQLRRLKLLPLAPPSYPFELPQEPLTLFVVHRTLRIDALTGLLALVPQLVVPFIGQSDFLRTWFISMLLPLLRLEYEYYPESQPPSLEAFTRLNEPGALDLLLQNARTSKEDTLDLGRDLRGLVGPWVYGHSERKRRRLNTRRASIASIDLEGEEQPSWERVFGWLVRETGKDFRLVASAIDEWDGPGDVDLGGYENGGHHLDEETQQQLEVRYAQTAFASVYALNSSDITTIEAAHKLLVRLAALMDLERPLDLNTDIELLDFDFESPIPDSVTSTIFQLDQLMQQGNPLTDPSEQTFTLLQLLVQSSYLLSKLGQLVSIRAVAKMYLFSDATEQFSMAQKILHALSTGPKRNAKEWTIIQRTLLWLWNWGTDAESQDALYGKGVFGKIERHALEKEILRALLDTAHYALAVKEYVEDRGHERWLSKEEMETVILESAMNYYDNATNGNRTRGGMKRASDIVTTFDKHFPSSPAFQRAKALLGATHSLSFYSLTLQHGVPFQPVNIRVSSDPLSLLKKVLEQNSHSYTHLDDLISIGQNLVVAAPIAHGPQTPSEFSPANILHRRSAAERRVIGMAIEAALAEDDFETAYSYVVNRLTPTASIPPYASPSTPTSSRRRSMTHYFAARQKSNEEDDVSWRAALQAGRYNSSPMSSSYTSIGSAAPPALRRLEQRMELLSQALLLAPPSHLPEVLTVWQECEREMTTLLADEAEAELRFNDQADRKLPGAFTETMAVQPRREVGRGAVEESPMGLFDVARGAAAAFSKSAFPLRGAKLGDGQVDKEGGSAHSHAPSDGGSIHDGEDGGRVRKRDMVANAVTGGLASGLGWVLGAAPVQHEQDQ